MAGVEVIQAGSQVFKFADKHGKNAEAMLGDASFGSSPSDAVRLGFEVKMMGTMWELASSLVKDLTEPLKSIVNK